MINVLRGILANFANITMALLGIGALALLGVICKEEGVQGVWTTMRSDVWGVAVRYLPTIVIFFTITGGLNHLQKHHADEFRSILSGQQGVVKMVLLAASLPGPAGGQQLHDQWERAESNKWMVLLCLIAMMGLNVNILIFRSRVLGGELTAIWLAIASTLLGTVWFLSKLQ